MKINAKKGLIILGHADTQRWEDGGPDGYDFRRATKGMARLIANKRGKSVEIYASSRDGGWMAEQVTPEYNPNGRR